MPPRRSARVAAVSEREREARSARIVAAAQHAAPALAPLPYALVLHILSLLPVDCRLLCAGVCRSWRAALEDRSLWIRLDLSACGVSPNKREVTEALLLAAAARAGGHLEALSVAGHGFLDATLLTVVTANGGALRELRAQLDFSQLAALLRAAPLLQSSTLRETVLCHGLAELQRLLRGEPPLAALRLESLYCEGPDPDSGEEELDEAAVVALAALLAGHAPLTGVVLWDMPLRTPAALNAVVDAAISRRWTSVTLNRCVLSPASAPALARLVGGAPLEQLGLSFDDDLLDAPAVGVLGAALRGCATLTKLKLQSAALWDDPAAAAALLAMLTGHASLQTLKLRNNRVAAAHQATAGAAIAALVAANVPALTSLDISFCDLRDAGLGPLFDALPANTHLRTLDCDFNWLSDAFVRDAMLPAVRANSSLRELQTGLQSDAALEAEALVQRRADAQ
jgi:hypothetical protein